MTFSIDIVFPLAAIRRQPGEVVGVLVSADIEGMAGITHWDEADRQHPDYDEFRAPMTAEAVAVCEGATAAGATDILVGDAHASGRTLNPGMRQAGPRTLSFPADDAFEMFRAFQYFMRG